MSRKRKRRKAQSKARITQTPKTKANSLAEQSLTESRKANFWQRAAFLLGAITVFLTIVGAYYGIEAYSSSQPNVTARASLGWVMDAGSGFYFAQQATKEPRPVGAGDAIIFDVTDRGGTGVRIESLTLKYNCKSHDGCLIDNYSQTSQVGSPGQLTLPLYLQANDSASLPVPLGCNHEFLSPDKPTDNVIVHAFTTLTGGQIIPAGSVAIPGIAAKAAHACEQHG